MANKHMKRYLKSLVMEEMEDHNEISLHVRIYKMEKTDHSKCWQRCG